MKDETYAFISDVKEKKVAARSARHMRTHCGKGGRVRLPSDNLSKKELEKMNGECKSYRLNDPMAWNEFKAMPDDIKCTYIKLLRGKYGATDRAIAEMMKVSTCTFSKEINRLGITTGKHTGSAKKWDKEGFWAWVNGVELPTTVPEEEPVEAPVFEVTQEDIAEIEQVTGIKNLHIKAETYVEDDLPFEEPDPITAEEIIDMQIRIDELLKENEELKAVHEKNKAEIAWLRNECDRHQMDALIAEKQMEVVRLIFGGVNHV